MTKAMATSVGAVIFTQGTIATTFGTTTSLTVDAHLITANTFSIIAKGRHLHMVCRLVVATNPLILMADVRAIMPTVHTLMADSKDTKKIHSLIMIIIRNSNKRGGCEIKTPFAQQKIGIWYVFL